MKEVDELVPLSGEDIRRLEAKRYSSNMGCGIFLMIIFAIAGYLAYREIGYSYLWLLLLVIIAVPSLIFGLKLLFSGPTENKKITLDLTGGHKRRIVAPIEEKEISEPTQRMAFSTRAQIARSGEELKFKYFMRVKEWKFNITEEQYLAGASKGDFVEFFVAPHSGEILSEPIEVRE